MSKLLEKVKYMVGLEDIEEDEVYEYEVEPELEAEEETYEEIKTKKKDREMSKTGKVVSLHTPSTSIGASTNANVKVMIYEPKEYDEVTKMIEELKDRKIIVINMLGLEQDLKSNVFHCLSGAVYALEGSMQKVAKDIFVIAPSNIEVDSKKLTQEMSSRGIFPWQR